jgi:hypothetical protein
MSAPIHYSTLGIRPLGVPPVGPPIPSGLLFRSWYVLIPHDAGKEREIIRLWNRVRLLEKEGRQTTAVRRLIEKALAARERDAA